MKKAIKRFIHEDYLVTANIWKTANRKRLFFMIFSLPGRKGLGDLWSFLRLERHQGYIPGSQAVPDIFLSRDLQLLTMAGWENRDKDSQSDIAAENEILIPNHGSHSLRSYQSNHIRLREKLRLKIDRIVYISLYSSDS